MKCETCRKTEVSLTSRWERFKYWIMKKLFSQDLIDSNQEKYMQGFGDGYKTAIQHGQEKIKESKELMDQIFKGDTVPNLNDLYGEIKTESEG